MKTNLFKFKSLITIIILIVASNFAFAKTISNGIVTYELNETELTAAVIICNSQFKEVILDSVVTDDDTNLKYRVTSIKNNVFNYRGLRYITIPNSITEIGNNNFLKDINSLTVIANGCCYADRDTTYLVCYKGDVTDTTSYTIKEGTKWIGISAFTYGQKPKISEITVPSSVKVINGSAFSCKVLTNLKNINMLGEVPAEIDSYANITCPITVPCGTINAYKTSGGPEFENLFQYKPLSYAINCTVNDSTMGDVIVPENICDAPLTAIAKEGYQFVQWSDGNTENPRIIELTQDTTFVAEFTKTLYITFEGDSIMGTIVGNNTAINGEVVTLDVMPNYGYHFTQWSDGVTDCPREFTINNDTTIIAEFDIDKRGTCGHSNSLTWEYGDNKTLYISGEGALDENYTFGVEAPNKMEHIIIAENVTSIGNKAFYNICSKVNSLELANVITIGDSAFANASKLRTINFGSDLEAIGNGAFSNCINVREMTCSIGDVPSVEEGAIKDINSSAKLYVPENDFDFYKSANGWGRFDVQVIQGNSERTEISREIVEVRSVTKNEATIAWPVYDEAESYTLEITKNGEVYCTLIFNSFGQLTGIAFMPGKDGNNRKAPVANMTADGMQFMVTNLDSGTNYKVLVDIKEGKNSLKTFNEEFTTESDEEGIEETFVNSESRKVIRNGQVLIQFNNKTYTIQGQIY